MAASSCFERIKPMPKMKTKSAAKKVQGTRSGRFARPGRQTPRHDQAHQEQIRTSAHDDPGPRRCRPGQDPHALRAPNQGAVKHATFKGRHVARKSPQESHQKAAGYFSRRKNIFRVAVQAVERRSNTATRPATRSAISRALDSAINAAPVNWPHLWPIYQRARKAGVEVDRKVLPISPSAIPGLRRSRRQGKAAQ